MERTRTYARKKEKTKIVHVTLPRGAAHVHRRDRLSAVLYVIPKDANKRTHAPRDKSKAHTPDPLCAPGRIPLHRFT